ncbi:MAG: hypothetical protein ACE3L7_33030 [Candidatus Pristimantibacillus sp.]
MPIIITDSMIEVSYEHAKMVYHNQMAIVDALKEIEHLSGMSQSSAKDYIGNFADMMAGSAYTRTMKNKATEYYLNGIKRDYGIEQLKLAVSSVSKHAKYYGALGKGQLRYVTDLAQRIGREISMDENG